MPQLRHLLVGEHGSLQLDQMRALGLGLEKVLLRANRGLSRGDNLFADAVDGRVRDLREELLEVVEQVLRLVRQHGQRSVRAHRADGFHAVARHGNHEDAQIFKRVTERLLTLEHGLVARLRQMRRFRQLADLDHVLIEPLAVGMFGGDLVLDLVVGHDAAFFGVDEEHAAGLEPAFVENSFRRNFEHASLGRHDDEVVLRHVVTRRAEAVAVERRADLFAVREGDGRRAIPRFHQARVKLVERLLLIAHRLVVTPWLRNHHHHRVRQRTPGEHEQLEDVVEHRGVAAVGVDDGEELLEIVSEEIGFHHRLARACPVDVSAQRVDLAVVRHVAIRMAAFPARKGVCRETGVNQRERRLHRRVFQVGVIRIDLRRHQHAFIDERLVGKAGDVEEAAAGNFCVTDGILRAFADDVEFTLERHVVGKLGAARDENLAHERLAGLRGFTERGVVRRDVTPAEEALAFFDDDAFKNLFALAPLGSIRRKENHADAVLADAGQ